VWKNIKNRCYNPRVPCFKYYGARGIVMSDEWRESFQAFLRDMGDCPPAHTIDRIDNNGPYAAGNCRWATYHQQARNYRRNVLLEFDGQRLVATDWDKVKGFKPKTILNRLSLGWSVERALTTPVRH